MDQLTRDEAHRLQRSISRGLTDAADDNILAVGFGAATKRGRHDPDRPFAACVYVARKKKSPGKGTRVRGEVSVRLKRGDRFVRVTVPTDVVEAPRLAPSGRFVTRQGEWLGSAGVVVAWKRSVPEWRWGVVTVGHLFDGTSGSAASLRAVLPNGAQLPCDRLFRSARTEHLDSALLEVEPADLVLHGVTAVTSPPTARPFWAQNALVSAIHAASESNQPLVGASLRSFADVAPFEVTHYFPESDQLIPELGNLFDFILVRATEETDPAPFIGGTSGSAFDIAGLGAAVQVGHDVDTSMIGAAQFLDTQLFWVRGKLNALDPSDPIQELRHVATF